MYTLSVGAIFKNESHCIKEWIEHYIFHGVEHFYLIDDQSTDDSVAILQPYIDKHLVTLYNPVHDCHLGRQRDLYNECILPHFNRKETKWLLMCDLDEFVWSPSSINLKEVLANFCNDFWQIQIEHTLFGSNSHDKEVPQNTLVASYTRRSHDSPSKTPRLLKYFVNSDAVTIDSLNVHSAHGNPYIESSKFMIINDVYFVLNHYCCQSKEFWQTVKCSRGDADNYRVRTMADFDEYDQNDVEDTRLLEQNRGIHVGES